MTNILNNFFHLGEHKTNISTEIIAGATTFMTMAYVLAVMPAVLSTTGMDKNAIFIGTAFASCLASIIMGLFVNWPIALAPAMGFNVYFAAIASQTSGVVSWQVALGMVFFSGIILLILTASKFRQTLVDAIPDSLKHGIIVGIGLFIAVIGLKMFNIISINLHLGATLTEIIKSHGVTNLTPLDWDFKLSKFAQVNALLALIGITITALLMAKRVKGAILLGIIITTIIGIPLSVTKIYEFSFSLPSLKNLYIGALDIKDIWHLKLAPIIFSLTFIALMDTFGTLISVANRAKLLDATHSSHKLGKAMFVDAIGVTLGSILGVSTMTTYMESTTGVSAGGRTGLTAIIVGILFLLAIFLAPFFRIIPNIAIAPALIMVGFLLSSNIKKINFGNFTEYFPALLTILLIPLTYNITDGIAAGIIFYTLLKIITGKFKQLHWMMCVLTILAVLNYVFNL